MICGISDAFIIFSLFLFICFTSVQFECTAGGWCPYYKYLFNYEKAQLIQEILMYLGLNDCEIVNFY